MLLVGVLLAYFLILIGFLLIWHEKVYKDEEPVSIEVVEDRADAWDALPDDCPWRPAAHAELEVDGQIHLHRNERIVRVR